MSQNQKKEPTPPKHPIMTVKCVNKIELLDMVDQIADQGKQATISVTEGGWLINYTSGPSRKI